MGEKLFIYRYRDKKGNVRRRTNVSLKWTFLSIIIFFIILALVPILKKKKEVEKSKVIFELPGKNVLIKKVPLPETMSTPEVEKGKVSKKVEKPPVSSREKQLDEFYKKSGSVVKADKKTIGSEKVPKTSMQQKKTGPVPATASVQKSKGKIGGETVYIVQVGAFKQEKNALKLMEKLKRKGYKVFLSPEKHGELGLMYHVGLDPVKNRSKAISLKEKLLKEEGISGAYIKTEKR